MKKIRKIVKYGNAVVIRLAPQDLEDMDWQIGDLLDITECVKIKKAK